MWTMHLWHDGHAVLPQRELQPSGTRDVSRRFNNTVELARGTLRSGTHYDGDGGGSTQDLLHQTISVVERLHDLPLVFGHLKRENGGMRRSVLF